MNAPRVVVVGVGALGSHLILLCRNLKANFVVIDDDKVEAKNVMSQFHTAMSVGKNKAQALKDAMNGLFKVRIEAVPHRLVAGNVEKLLGDADLVVDCLDNAASRQVIQDFVRARNIPCLHGALDPDGQFGRVVWSSNFLIDKEEPGRATCEDGQHLPFIATTVSYLAWTIQQFANSGKMYNFNIFPGGVTRF